MSQVPAVYRQLASKSFAVNVIDEKGRALSIKSGQRFKCVGGVNLSINGRNLVYVCMMSPLADEGYKVFFLKEETLEPFHMPMANWINNFKHGRFILLDSAPDLSYDPERLAPGAQVRLADD